MSWYWYFTGMFTVIFFLSFLANIGFAQGWLRYERPASRKKEYDQIKMAVYDWSQDNSGPISRSN